MYPVAVRQAIKLGGNPQVGGLFPAGGTGAAVADISEVFHMRTAGFIAAKLFHAGDAGAAGEHFGDSFDFDIAQTTGVEERRPALVGGEQFFERAGTETGNHVAD